MSRKLPPLNALRAFEVAGRHVSFTNAAGELHVTHGAVSRQVASLEAWLGTPLFHRTPSGLSLTDAGRIYLAELTPLLDRLAVFTAQIKERAAPSVLRVDAPPTFTMRWLIARLSRFQKTKPDLEIRLTTSLAPVSFAENGYDIAIRGAHEPLRGCISQPFMTEMIVPVCHTKLVAEGRLYKPEDLSRHTLLHYSTEPYSWTDWFQTAGIGDLKVAGSLTFEQMYFALQAAVDGLGVVLAPLFLVIDDIAAGRLCMPFGPLAARQRRYYANAAQLSPAVKSFQDWLVREGQETEQSMAKWAQSMKS